MRLKLFYIFASILLFLGVLKYNLLKYITFLILFIEDILFIFLPLLVVLSFLFTIIHFVKKTNFITKALQIFYTLTFLGILGLEYKTFFLALFRHEYLIFIFKLLFLFLIIYNLIQSLWFKKRYFPLFPLMTLMLYFIYYSFLFLS